MLLLAKSHLANGLIPKMFEKNFVEQVNITIGFNKDDVILKVGMIILAKQCVNIICATNNFVETWETWYRHTHIYIYIDGKNIRVSMGVSVDKTNIDLNDIGRIDRQYQLRL